MATYARGNAFLRGRSHGGSGGECAHVSDPPTAVEPEVVITRRRARRIRGVGTRDYPPRSIRVREGVTPAGHTDQLRVADRDAGACRGLGAVAASRMLRA
jgi:hypothetical protein